jgi:hypothetical protein
MATAPGCSRTVGSTWSGLHGSGKSSTELLVCLAAVRRQNLRTRHLALTDLAERLTAGGQGHPSGNGKCVGADVRPIAVCLGGWDWRARLEAGVGEAVPVTRPRQWTRVEVWPVVQRTEFARMPNRTVKAIFFALPVRVSAMHGPTGTLRHAEKYLVRSQPRTALWTVRRARRAKIQDLPRWRDTRYPLFVELAP